MSNLADKISKSMVAILTNATAIIATGLIADGATEAEAEKLIHDVISESVKATFNDNGEA